MPKDRPPCCAVHGDFGKLADGGQIDPIDHPLVTKTRERQAVVIRGGHCIRRAEPAH